MLMQEALRMLMKVNRVTQQRAADYIKMNQRTISRVLNNDRLELSQAIELLDFLGYELIVREKGAGIRRNDEIRIDNEPEFGTKKQVEQVETMVDIEEDERIRKFLTEGRKYTCRDFILERACGNEELNKTQVAEILGVCYRTLINKWGDYFDNDKISTEKLIQILDRTSLVTYMEKIAEQKKNPYAVKTKEKLYKRIQRMYPDNIILNKTQVANILGVTSASVGQRYKEFFSDGVITIADFLDAFCIVGGKL